MVEIPVQRNTNDAYNISTLISSFSSEHRLTSLFLKKNLEDKQYMPTD